MSSKNLTGPSVTVIGSALAVAVIVGGSMWTMNRRDQQQRVLIERLHQEIGELAGRVHEGSRAAGRAYATNDDLREQSVRLDSAQSTTKASFSDVENRLEELDQRLSAVGNALDGEPWSDDVASLRADVDLLMSAVERYGQRMSSARGGRPEPPLRGSCLNLLPDEACELTLFPSRPMQIIASGVYVTWTSEQDSIITVNSPEWRSKKNMILRAGSPVSITYASDPYHISLIEMSAGGGAPSLRIEVKRLP